LKILFHLSYMKDGLLGQFTENVVQKMMEWEMLGLRVNFGNFIMKMIKTFRDVNRKVTAQE
jgi:hypothetical protein